MRRIVRAVSSVLIAVAAPGLAMPLAWASSWSVSVQNGSKGQSAAQGGPAAPASATAVCNSILILGNSVIVTWPAVPRATAYTILQATAAATGPYTSVAPGITTTSWTSGALASGSYWYEVTATIGASWSGPASTATLKRKIAVGLLCS